MISECPVSFRLLNVMYISGSLSRSANRDAMRKQYFLSWPKGPITCNSKRAEQEGVSLAQIKVLMKVLVPTYYHSRNKFDKESSLNLWE